MTSFYLLGQKYKNIFVHFLMQMETLKFAFQIYWPLEGLCSLDSFTHIHYSKWRQIQKVLWHYVLTSSIVKLLKVVWDDVNSTRLGNLIFQVLCCRVFQQQWYVFVLRVTKSRFLHLVFLLLITKYSTIVDLVKMENLCKIAIFGLKMMVKSDFFLF